MQGTREQVLQLVVDRREARVEDLAEALGITTAAVRRHLDHLRADGLVDVRSVRQATGRPYHAYFPTELAFGALPLGYADLLERMLRSMGSRADITDAVAEQMAETVAARHRAELAGVDAADPQERIVHVTASLKREGILEGWTAADDGFHLVNRTCPYRKAAEVSALPCESDRRTIEKLLGEEVRLINRIVDGSPVCEYLVGSNH
jgi:predicted ArsR family transcriptional regulator